MILQIDTSRQSTILFGIKCHKVHFASEFLCNRIQFLLEIFKALRLRKDESEGKSRINILAIVIRGSPDDGGGGRFSPVLQGSLFKWYIANGFGIVEGLVHDDARSFNGFLLGN